MEKDENFDELIAHYIEKGEKRHSGKRVVSLKEISKMASEQTGVDQETAYLICIKFSHILEKLYQENPTAVRKFIRETYGAELEKFDT